MIELVSSSGYFLITIWIDLNVQRIWLHQNPKIQEQAKLHIAIWQIHGVLR